MNRIHLSYKPTEKIVGIHNCKVCGNSGKLILREGKQFRIWFVDCPGGHRPTIKKEIDDIFQVGDRIRSYHVPFNSGIDYTSYNEGIIIAKRPFIVNYELELLVDKVVLQGKVIPKTSWLYGHVIKGIGSDHESIELLTPQMRMII
jgi:hypothetical protein